MGTTTSCKPVYDSVHCRDTFKRFAVRSKRCRAVKTCQARKHPYRKYTLTVAWSLATKWRCVCKYQHPEHNRTNIRQGNFKIDRLKTQSWIELQSSGLVLFAMALYATWPMCHGACSEIDAGHWNLRNSRRLVSTWNLKLVYYPIA